MAKDDPGERRSLERLGVHRGALLSIPGHLTAQSFSVRDLTVQGVGIRMNGITLLPLKFEISFDGFRTTNACMLGGMGTLPG